MEKRFQGIVTKTLGDLYLKQGMKAQARRIYEKLLEKHPDDEHLKKRIELTYSSGQAVPIPSWKEWGEEIDQGCVDPEDLKLEKGMEFIAEDDTYLEVAGALYSGDDKKSAEKTIKILKEWLEKLRE